MKQPIISFAIIASLTAGSVYAQESDFIDDFGVLDDNAPLEELMPNAELGIESEPYVSGTDSPDASPPQSTVTAEATPTPATPKSPQIEQFSAPADWQAQSIEDIHFSTPSSWVIMEEDRGGSKGALILFGGSKETFSGPLFGVGFSKEPILEEMLDDTPDDAEVTRLGEVLLSGMQFEKIKIRMTMPGPKGKIDASAIMYLSTGRTAAGKFLMVTTMSLTHPYEDHSELLNKALGTVTLVPATSGQPQADGAGADSGEQALDGLITFDDATISANGWAVRKSDDNQTISLDDQSGAGGISIAIGDLVNGDTGLDENMPTMTAAAVPSQIFGQPSMQRNWKHPGIYFYQNNELVTGQQIYHRLTQCLPDGRPVDVLLSAAVEFMQSEKFSEMQSSITLNLPDNMQDCPLVASPQAGTTEPDQKQLPQPDPAVSDPVNEPSVAPAQTQPAEASANAAVAAQGVLVDVQGASFVLPTRWTVINDSPSDKLLESPDGRFSILAFWWFPDEPLTGYGDDIEVAHMVVDHEPCTRITSGTASLLSILNVTERARSDQKRFIFTVESQSASLDELRELHDQLVKTLQFGPGFDPSQPRRTHAALQPGQQTQPLQQFRFTGNGTDGWRGENADLSSSATGGPDGAGMLLANTPGDGKDGYFLAPDLLLGDWSNLAGLKINLMITSGGGSYHDAFKSGPRGDVYIASGSKSAAINFHRPVETHWTMQTVDFNDADWVLSGGANSVRDVLGNVTDFHIRAEYLIGDTTSALASVDWIKSGGASEKPARQVAIVQADLSNLVWKSYENARFGTQVDYPSNLFSMLAQPENGDGISLQNKPANLSLYIFGQHNFNGYDIAELMQSDESLGGYDQVTYRKSGQDWYVLSGYKGGDDILS